MKTATSTNIRYYISPQEDKPARVAFMHRVLFQPLKWQKCCCCYPDEVSWIRRNGARNTLFWKHFLLLLLSRCPSNTVPGDPCFPDLYRSDVFEGMLLPSVRSLHAGLGSIVSSAIAHLSLGCIWKKKHICSKAMLNQIEWMDRWVELDLGMID